MRTVITAITAATFFLSGCLTPKVWNTGLHSRTAKGIKVYKAQEQSLAVETEITGLKGSYTKYFVRNWKSFETGLQAIPPVYNRSSQTVFIVIGGDHNAWQEYPPATVIRDASMADLPDKFSTSFSTYSFNDPILLNVSGTTEQIKLGGFTGLKKDRDPKSYPVLLLLPPAAIVDVAIGIVMAPVVILAFLYEGIAGHNGRPARDKN